MFRLSGRLLNQRLLSSLLFEAIWLLPPAARAQQKSSGLTRKTILNAPPSPTKHLPVNPRETVRWVSVSEWKIPDHGCNAHKKSTLSSEK